LTLNGPAGDALGQKVKVLKLGDPLDETSDIGTTIAAISSRVLMPADGTSAARSFLREFRLSRNRQLS